MERPPGVFLDATVAMERPQAVLGRLRSARSVQSPSLPHQRWRKLLRIVAAMLARPSGSSMQSLCEGYNNQRVALGRPEASRSEASRALGN